MHAGKQASPLRVQLSPPFQQPYRILSAELAESAVSAASAKLRLGLRATPTLSLSVALDGAQTRAHKQYSMICIYRGIAFAPHPRGGLFRPSLSTNHDSSKRCS